MMLIRAYCGRWCKTPCELTRTWHLPHYQQLPGCCWSQNLAVWSRVGLMQVATIWLLWSAAHAWTSTRRTIHDLGALHGFCERWHKALHVLANICNCITAAGMPGLHVLIDQRISKRRTEQQQTHSMTFPYEHLLRCSSILALSLPQGSTI